MPDAVLPWEFPACDHAAWQSLTGDSMPLASYRELQAAIEAIAAGALK